MSSPALERHKCCKNESSSVERVISGGTGLIFKGSGFYLTDYKNSNKEKKKKSTNSKTDKNSTKNTDSKKTGKKNS
jgi:predicted nucleic acid-binding Zn ribbon protein